MPFEAGLRQLLYVRDRQLASEFHRGDSLEEVLNRHLLTVERMAERELVTSILLLSADGRRLYHAAGPNLPQPYRQAIDGSEIGPTAGSCGTAAFLGRPIYVSDIASDPLWADYRHLALPHGLRSCWSTPIRSDDGAIIGTFAIYRREPGSPAEDEIAAIDLIAGHVAQAISWAREAAEAEERAAAFSDAPRLRLVAANSAMPEHSSDPLERLLAKVGKLEAIARELTEQAASAESGECRAEMEAAAHRAVALAATVRQHIEQLRTVSR